jgi:opine dehydrogenase
LWRRSAAAFGELQQTRTLTLLDQAGERPVTLAAVTADIGEAVTGAALVVIAGPAFAQCDIAKAMAPVMRDGQVVFLPPGTFGSYVMASALRNAGCAADVTFAETGTLPYLTRKHGELVVAITRRATRLPTGMFPARNDAAARSVISGAYPSIEPSEDALSGALMNAGPIIHPPLIIMNAGPIEHFEHWDIHNEGTQHSIRRVTDQLDGERVAIREALGYGAPHFPLADHYNPDGAEWMYGRKAHSQLVDSGEWREDLNLREHRYMREDVALGLAFLASAGRFANVATPVASGLLALGGAICGEDFNRSGRTLERLGLEAYSRKQLTDVLQNGL